MNFDGERARLAASKDDCTGDTLTYVYQTNLPLRVYQAFSLLSEPERIRTWDRVFVSQCADDEQAGVHKRLLSLANVLPFPELAKKICPDTWVYFYNQTLTADASGTVDAGVVLKKTGVARSHALDLQEATFLLLPVKNGSSACRFTFVLTFTVPELGASRFKQSCYRRGIDSWMRTFVAACESVANRRPRARGTSL